MALSGSHLEQLVFKRRTKFLIDCTTPGVLTYREGYKEYCFPIFEQSGETVFVNEPSYQRLFLFFFWGGWHWVPEFIEPADRDRITTRVLDYLRNKGKQARVMDRGCEDANCQFHPELFEARSQASEALANAGITWLQDYNSIDLLHDLYGLEICGIAEDDKVDPIAKAMQKAFPQWHFGKDRYEHCGREPGWRFSIHMFSRCCVDGQCG